MRFRDDINKIMDSVDVNVDNEMKNKILNQTTRSSERKHSFIGTRKAVAVAMAAVLCIGTMVVGVGAVTGVWDDLFDKVVNRQIEVDQQQKSKLIENGYVGTVDEKNISCDKDGLKVSLIQTVADKYRVYVYLKVETEDVVLEEGMHFRGQWLYLEGVGDITSIHGDITPISEHEGVMELSGEINYTIDEGELNIEGKELKVKLWNLETQDMCDKSDNDYPIESDWEISWKGNSNKDSKFIQLYETMKVNNAEIIIESFEITPLTVVMRYDFPEFNADGDFYVPFAVVMKDGIKHKYDHHGLKGIFQPETSGRKESYIRIERPIDISEIDYIEICGTKYDVK